MSIPRYQVVGEDGGNRVEHWIMHKGWMKRVQDALVSQQIDRLNDVCPPKPTSEIKVLDKRFDITLDV